VLLAGCKPAAETASSGSPTGYRLGLIYFGPDEGAENCIAGLVEALAAQGIEQGRNLEILRAHAQGEIANIPLLVRNFDNQNLDLIVTLTTPCLTAAVATVQRTPVVFMYCYDPIAAGAGVSRTEHPPNITGVGSFPPVESTIDVLQQIVPGLAGVATVYNNAEANSVKVVGVARQLFVQRGIRLEEVVANSTSEVFQAAQVAAARGVQAIWIGGDNTAIQSFDAIVKVAEDARLPLVINDPEYVSRGATLAVGLGWRDSGRAAGEIAARVLRGESPATIPFAEVATRKVAVNVAAAEALGIALPSELVTEAASSA
jgi:putative ABC transport system substrate-binding protein